MVLAVLAALLVGCGRRGDPLPPGKRLPGAPAKLSLSAPDGRLTLSWAAPREDLAGRAVLPLGGYAILRQAWPPGTDSCESCPEDLSQVANLDTEQRRAQRLPPTSWTDEEARAGWTYRYRVRALDTQGRPGALSGPVTVRWAPLAPPAVQATAGDGQALLRVDPGPRQETPPGSFRVYGEGRKIVEVAASAPEFAVAGLPNGTPARLSVRVAGKTSEGWELESAGTEVTVTPVDTTPPFPPADLAAFSDERGVELRWLPSGKEPYAKITVLRATDASRFEPVAELPGNALSYRDPTAKRGEVYRYAVEARDPAGNRSLPTREARVRVP